MSKEKQNEEQWLKDFNEFLQSDTQQPPEEVNAKILAQAHQALHPSALQVFLKLILIHSVFGSLSLAICHQFNLNPFKTSISISDYFLSYGHSVCMLICGLIFFACSLFAAWTFLNQDEFFVIQRNYILQFCFLSFLSLGVFMILGADITISIAGFWLLGGLLGGALPTWALPELNTQNS